MQPREASTPPWLVPVLSVFATVVAVVAVLTLPHLLSSHAVATGPDRPLPSPSAVPDPPGDRDWQATRCPHHARACSVPERLDHAGVLFRLVRSSRLRVSAHQRQHQLSAVLTTGDERWVLVGVQRGGAHSILTVGLGRASTFTLRVASGEPLTLFPVSQGGPATITVGLRGAPVDGEVLRIAEYTVV